MRKLLYNANGMASPPIEPPLLPRNSSSFHNISRRLISETPTPAPSPSPFPLEEYKHQNLQMTSPPISFSDSIFDIATFCIILALIVLSILCLSFILHLFLKSRKLRHLQNFNSFWILRLALITFAMIWALNEVLRLPFIRRNNYLYRFLPLLTQTQQSNLCKIHVVLSFGFLQPGFFLTLLFLVNISIQKKNPHFIFAFASICALCCPLTVLQFLFVFYTPLQNIFPTFMHITSLSTIDLQGNKMVFCTYPLLSCIIFSGFAIAYSFAFLLTSWRVVAFVINKSIRVRINVLSFAVMISFPVQILCLGILPWFWHQDPAYCFVGLVMFLDIAICMAVGQIILVLKPIADALTAGGEGGRCTPEIRQRPQLLDDGGWHRI